MKKARKTLNSIGLRYSLFAGTVFLVQVLTLRLLKWKFPGFVRKNAVFLQLALVVVSIYLAGFSVLVLLLKNQPKWEKPDQSMGTGRFLVGITKCCTINVIGAILGFLVSFLISGSQDNTLAELLAEKEYRWLSVLVVGILAPVFEEVIFRKLLIDHLAHKGKWLSIITSGLFFGLYHGNFTQFFYATGLGLFFAYIYVTTGRLRYSIAYHMMINLQSSLIGVELLKSYREDLVSGNVGTGYFGGVFYALCIFSLAFVGFIFWIIDIVNGKSIESGCEKETVRNGGVLKAFFSSWGVWLFLCFCAYRFLTYYRS